MPGRPNGGLKEGLVIRQRFVSMLIGVTAAALLAACAAGPGATWTPLPVGPSSSPRPAPSASEPTSEQSPVPSPDGSGVACASDLPTTLASVDDLADPSCYGATDLTIDGWLAEADIWLERGVTDPAWTMPISTLFPRSLTIDEWVFDYDLVEQITDDLGKRVSVVAPPEASLDLSGTGRWARLVGHFNDPVASACTQLITSDEPDAQYDGDCERLFVVSSLEAVEPPAPTCPTASPITLDAFLAADHRCYAEGDVSISGWEDVGEGFGGVVANYQVEIDPAFELAGAQLVAARWEEDVDHMPIFPWTIAGSEVTFDRTDREVAVTGHFADAAASGCRPSAPGEDWPWSPPDSWAQHRCERLFVITEVRATG
jgi:hypothetical protein